MARDPWSVTACVLVYRILTWAYPPAFRREFGASMTQLFRDACRDAYGERGVAGLFEVWWWGLEDCACGVWAAYREAIPSRALARLGGAGGLALAALALWLWVASHGDSVGLFGLGRDTSLRFANGVMEVRQVHGHGIAAPVPEAEWFATATRRGWVVPTEPSVSSFAYSTGHVLGMGGVGVVTPMEYELCRVPLWACAAVFLTLGILLIRNSAPAPKWAGLGETP